MQLTLSLLAGLYVKIERIEGIERIELTFHWYIGIAPLFMAVDEKVTADSGQKGFADAAIAIPSGSKGGSSVEHNIRNIAG